MLSSIDQDEVQRLESKETTNVEVRNRGIRVSTAKKKSPRSTSEDNEFAEIRRKALEAVHNNEIYEPEERPRMSRSHVRNTRSKFYSVSTSMLMK